MNLQTLNLKVIIALAYLAIISIGLYFLFSVVDIQDLMSIEFIRSNKDIILKYKNENFLFLTAIFFIFSVIWVFLLGFAMPLLVFSGFVFGKWWGIIIVLTATTIGATLLYVFAGYFFRDLIQAKLAPKFYKLQKFFEKNDIIYFMSYRFVGGGGTPYGIQNILPLLFNMSIKNYIIATFLGSMPSMFVTVSLGSGVEKTLDKDSELSVVSVISSPDIYLPIIGFFILIILAFFIKRNYFKNN